MNQEKKSVGEQTMLKYSSNEEDKEIEELNKELKKNLKDCFWALLRVIYYIISLFCELYVIYILLKYHHII